MSGKIAVKSHEKLNVKKVKFKKKDHRHNAVDVPHEIMLAASRKGMLSLLLIPYRTYSATLRPCDRARRNSGTLTGMDRCT